MTTPVKQPVLQGSQVVLYSRALHPDLFQLRGRRVLHDHTFELEAWVMDGGHALRFEHKSLCITELLCDAEKPVPQGSIVAAFLAATERDFDHKFPKDGVNYLTTVQTETLSENLYQSTYNEMIEFAKETQALAHRWNDETGKCLSIIDAERTLGEVHVQCYHLIAATGTVVRIQSLFEHK